MLTGMNTEFTGFLADGKHAAWRSVWQGIFLLPAIVLWLLGLDLPPPLLIAIGGALYLVSSILGAYALDRWQTPAEKAVEALMQDIASTSDRLSEIESQLARAHLEGVYDTTVARLSEAVDRHRAYLAHLETGSDELMMGVDLTAVVEAINEWNRVFGANLVAKDLKPGCVAELNELRLQVEAGYKAEQAKGRTF
ncbi:hypothetical protein X772_02965 [Mesorhizobium sp. LSJC280B00]|nr:hypothetical protein X772_02965 [Mesorhizobium sp. LSJC280B00]